MKKALIRRWSLFLAMLPGAGLVPNAFGQEGASGTLNLEISQITSNAVSLVLHGTQSGLPYEIQSKQSLNDASWTLETTVTGAAGTNLTPATVPIRNNAPTLFMRIHRESVSLSVAPRLAVGNRHLMQLLTSGDLVLWGGNDSGELGDFTWLASDEPVHVVSLNAVTNLAAGYDFSLGVDANGQLWSWGYNGGGLLGIGEEGLERTNFPVPVPAMTNILTIAGSSSHVLAVQAGAVWTWGGVYEFHTNAWRPVRIEALTNVTSVAAGAGYSLALKGDGTVWTWGANDYGQLGDGTTDSREIPAPIQSLSNIVAICAGEVHNLALDTHGAIWAWGRNWNGQLGDGTTDDQPRPVLIVGITNAASIAAGSRHSLAADAAGHVWTWGNNESGQLGNGRVDSPIIYTMTTIPLGNVVTDFLRDPEADPRLPAMIAGISNIISVAAGFDTCAALQSDQRVWVWGNENGVPDPAPELIEPYADYYHGQVPLLEIVSGNNQTVYQTLEFAEPLVLRVTDSAHAPLPSAPLSVEVVSGNMYLRNESGGVNYPGLRSVTSANGEVSVIGYAAKNPDSTNYVVKVLGASKAWFTRIDFHESSSIPEYPTVTITSPTNGSTLLFGPDRGIPFTVEAQGTLGPIERVTYYELVEESWEWIWAPIGSSAEPPFSFSWTNTDTESGSHVIGAIATDSLGLESDMYGIELNLLHDADGNGLPDAWEIQFFNQTGIDPNADADGDGLSNLQEYLAGSNPADYYNGTLPTLAIITGDNQSGTAGSFLPQPLTVLVRRTDLTPLTNAPVVYSIEKGGVQLAAETNGTLATNLVVRTDANGLASIWIYFPSGADLLDNRIAARAWSGDSFVEVIAHPILPSRLAYWRFETADWRGEAGQLPWAATGVSALAGWSGNALNVDDALPARLGYQDSETNGTININLRLGSIRFWFKPNWNSSALPGGSGPGNEARLIEAGNLETGGGWWGLTLSGDGTRLSFTTLSNCAIATHLIVPICWNSEGWHQVVLTYGPDYSSLYLDGLAITNGTGLQCYPAGLGQGDGFWIGSRYNGNNQARGQFDELETFNHQLAPAEIATAFHATPRLNPPTLRLDSTNAAAAILLTMQQAEGAGIVSSVSGVAYPNPLSVLVAGNYADALRARSAGSLASRSVGVNISKLPPPRITPGGGYFNSASNVLLSLGLEDLTDLVAGIYRTELGRAGEESESQATLAYAQGLRDLGCDDEDIRTNLINGDFFRGSLEYIGQHGAPDVYLRNAATMIVYSTDGGTTWNDYTSPIPITNSTTLMARALKAGSADLRTQYAYLASEAATALFNFIPESWLVQHFGTQYQSETNALPDADPDHDGLSNLGEFQRGTNPLEVDTDYDGRNDGQEVSEGTDPLDPNSAFHARLGRWRFNTTEWLGDEGQAPLGFTNVAAVPDWSVNALQVDNEISAYLAYRDVEDSGSANINLRNGALRFWFKPDWNSVTTNNGTGPGSEGRLIECGSQEGNGWWALWLSAGGDELRFVTQSNGVAATNLILAVNWTSNDWHQIVLTSGPTNSALHLDGQLVTNGIGVSLYPDRGERANGFRIGSDPAGNRQARGQFDELETFNYPLSPDDVAANYNAVIADSDGDGLSNEHEALLGTNPHNPDSDGDGVGDYLELLQGRNPNSFGAVPDTGEIVNLKVFTPLF